MSAPACRRAAWDAAGVIVDLSFARVLLALVGPTTIAGCTFFGTAEPPPEVEPPPPPPEGTCVGARTTPGDVEVGDARAAEDLCGDQICTTVAGRLTVGGTMTNAAGLDCVVAVTEDLYLDAPSLRSTHGLENLRAVAGSVRLGRAALDLDGLVSLEVVGGLLDIRSAEGVQSFRGLDSLQEIGVLALRSESLSSLRGLEGVHTIGWLEFGPVPRLEDTSALGQLRSVPEVLEITGEALPSTIVLDLEELGRLTVRDAPNLTTLALGAPTMTGSVYFSDVPQLEEATFAPRGAAGVTLQGVGPSVGLGPLGLAEGTTVAVRDADLVELFVGDPGASTSVSVNQFSVERNPALTSIRTAGIADVAWGLVIRGNEALQSLDGMDSLVSVSGRSYIEGNPSLERVDGLTSLRVVEDLEVTGNRLSAFALPALEEGRFITVEEEPVLEQVGPLPSLATVTSLTLENNPSLERIAGLDAWVAGGGALNVGQNPSLTDLEGLAAMRVVGRLSLTANASLESLAPLHGVESITGLLLIQSNGRLAPEEVDALLESIGPENIEQSSIRNNGLDL